MMRLVLEAEAYGVELTWGTTYKGTMLPPSVIAVYSTGDQMLRKKKA
jgi:hypothetical protein